MPTEHAVHTARIACCGGLKLNLELYHVEAVHAVHAARIVRCGGLQLGYTLKISDYKVDRPLRRLTYSLNVQSNEMQDLQAAIYFLPNAGLRVM